MNELAIAACPVCQNVDGGSCRGYQHSPSGYPSAWFDCEICGRYAMDTAIYLDGHHPGPSNLDWSHWNLTTPQRAVLAHRIRLSQESLKSRGDLFTITRDTLDWLRSNAALPARATQAANIIRYIGDEVSRSGRPIDKLPIHFHAIIGATSHDSGYRLLRELEERGMLKLQASSVAGPREIDLTLGGWQAYEVERRGKFKSNYGFIAMRFNDAKLDPFVKEVVKPAVKDRLGYDLVDMRDVARAGVIDNIMRTQIRDSAFVIVDLTHDNPGAYWEAGYAEGLGKPVIYICEKTKFEAGETHFDTNHCTTVPWSRDDDDGFRAELVATLRRSLDAAPGPQA